MVKRQIRAAWATCALAAVVWACGGDGTGPATGLQPDVLAIAPDSGSVGTQVAITGSNFEPNATVAFGLWSADSAVVLGATTVLAYAPDSLERDSVYGVSVTNPGGLSDALTGAYKAVAPFLQAVNGVSKPSGNSGSTVLFEGKSFGDLLGKGKVFFTDAGGLPVEAVVTLPENWTNEFLLTAVPTEAVTGPTWIETPIGSTDSVVFTILETATFNPAAIDWNATTALPDSSQGHGAVFLAIEQGSGAGNLIYVTGGASGALVPRTSVAYAEVDLDGALSAYTATSSLPQARAFHGALAATPFNALIDTAVAGYLYVVGGIDDAGDPTTTVYVGAVDKDDRSVGAWMQTTPLPVPLHSMGVAIFRSYVFVVGGATTGNAPTAAVYRAPIQPDGSLGAWEAQAALPYPRAYAPLVQFAGVLYSLGGDSAAAAPGSNAVTLTTVSDIHYHPLDLRTRVLRNPSWTLNPNALIKKSSSHSAVVAGGTVLVSGGIYEGASSSSTEQQYAVINLDGTIGTFNGATGDNTIAGATGAGGVPPFHHAAVSYVDADGDLHVMILGGNHVNSPSNPVPNTYFTPSITN